MQEDTLKFGALCFSLGGGKIALNGAPFVEIQIAGQNKDNHLGAKHVCLSEHAGLRYVSHERAGNVLRIVQESALVRAVSVFTSFEDSSAIAVYTEVTNISAEDMTVESVSSFVYPGLAPTDELSGTYLYRFLQSHHGECRPRKNSLAELGLEKVTQAGQYRVAHANVGSWSTKEALPQGIVEHGGRFTMFQIESSHSWYYELSDEAQQVYLYLGAADEDFCGWSKNLAPGQTYRTVTAALCFAESVGQAVADMTRYRRRIAGKHKEDESLPVIFNEYMHLSWDSPDPERTKRVAPYAARAGAEYYVIDCGWHDEVPGSEVYPYVGAWRESKARFPDGLRKTTDFIRSLGMKAGLWIEPEVVGYKCNEMLGYYGDECFLHRHGKKICVMGRYFLDYRAQKVRGYMTETIRRMVEEYGAQYIKFDYNQDMGAGTDSASGSLGEGLEQSAAAFFSWADEMRGRFPQVLFETCASGGMRMDYETLKHFSIVSTSDQTDYRQYPYIAANVLAAALPEQAAVWSYPVAGVPAALGGAEAARWAEEHIGEERAAMNMVNAMLGRMHLASDLSLLTPRGFALVREGVSYYKKTAAAKKSGVPVFPDGFVSFGDRRAAAGYESGGRLYLAVWALGADRCVRVPLGGGFSRVAVGYPSGAAVAARIAKGQLSVRFTGAIRACVLEIER